MSPSTFAVVIELDEDGYNAFCSSTARLL